MQERKREARRGETREKGRWGGKAMCDLLNPNIPFVPLW
jgi:hypothetical protein